mgnify:CR=1 FL=1
MKKDLFDLRRFDGTGGGESGNGGDASHASGESTQVLYGRKDDGPEAGGDDGGSGHDADGNGAADSKDLSSEFEDLIKGKYKDIYDKRVQDNINRRFKASKELEEKISRYSDVLNPLYDRYDVDNIDDLEAAMQQDDDLVRDKAMELGLSPEAYRRQMALEQQNRRAAEQLQAIEGQKQAEKDMQEWVSQSAELNKMYPEFDLAAELENPDFVADLRAGKSVRKAYESAHLDDILGGAIVKVAQQTAKNVTDNIRARGFRPEENGTSNAPGIVIKNDPTKYDEKDLMEIRRRVSNGEKIIL